MESLYRKYRPQTFESMVGQRHIVSTLQNALADGRMAHAYLFTGPRGTGKTTTARLLAKALMCEAGEGGPTAHPDGTCEQCQEIARGTHPDVYELDAASRTGVDNVRDEIINRVAFAPTQGRYKVYVIDEVHMLTTAAFNALLKTLEEPPAHVVFVLCTTDPQKIPETVLSRCQRLEFHRISDDDIAERLKFVCSSEGFDFDDEALALVARHARGGLRDALSTLETLSVHGRGSVHAQDARELLGEVADDTLSGMADLVAARDVAGCFARVDEMSSRGMDIEQYVRDFTRHMRNVYVAGVAGKGAFKDEVAAQQFEAQAGLFGGSDRLAHILDLLGGLEDTLRTSTDQRLDFEVALTRMARPKADLSLEALAARVEALEGELAAVRAGGLAGAGVQALAGAAPAGMQAAGGVALGQPAVPAPVGGTQGFGAGSASVTAGAAAQGASPATGAGASAAADLPQAQQPAVSQDAAAQAAPAQPSPMSSQAGAAASTLPAFARMPQAQQQPTAPQGAAAQAASAASRPASAGMPQAQRAVAPQGVAPAAQAASAQVGAHVADACWAQICQRAGAVFMPVTALLNKAIGYFAPDGTLVVENQGSDFVAKQLQRDNPMRALKQAAEQVMGRPVPIRVVGAGASVASTRTASAVAGASAPSSGFGAPATQPTGAARFAGGMAQPARGFASSVPVQGVSASTARPSFGSAVQPTSSAGSSDAVLPAFARMPQNAAPASQAPRASAPAPSAPADDASALPAFARMPQAAAPAAPAAPADDAPAFEFVPDDMYDSYQDVSADVPADGYEAPWDEPAPAPVPKAAPAASAPVAQTSRFASAPASAQAPQVASSSTAPVAQASQAAPAPSFARPAQAAAPSQPARFTPPASPQAASRPMSPQPASSAASASGIAPQSGEDPTAWLSQLLEAGFGGPVKITRE